MLSILQHTIGADDYGRIKCERNHFVTGSSGFDLENCLKAVELGLMCERTNEISSSLIGGEGSRLFHVTKEGFLYVENNSKKPPKLTRSQRRFARYREYGDGFDNFRHFLAWDADPERPWNQTKTA